MTIRILVGDVREKLCNVPDESVHCVVTSPPYYGLRDYGTAQWDGGDPACSHRIPATGSTMNKGNNNREGPPFPAACGLCGALRQDRQIGLEDTPQAYIETLVAVFREVRRVLRSDGTLWLNLGDSYAGGGAGPQGGSGQMVDRSVAAQRCRVRPGNRGASNRNGLGGVNGAKPKDLLMIPARVALALQADGWWLRSDIIWAKPNPMPESVTDRPTSAHEHVFLLAKSETYYFDQEAVKEPLAPSSVARLAQDISRQAGSLRAHGGAKTNGPMKAVGTPRNDGDRWNVGVNSSGFLMGDEGARNIRNVWTIATQPYSEAHFATFPPALVEPCIKAGCPVGGLVLDPFGGAGTVGLVADRLGRNAILIELNPAYAAMAENRARDDAGMFASVSRHI